MTYRSSLYDSIKKWLSVRAFRFSPAAAVGVTDNISRQPPRLSKLPDRNGVIRCLHSLPDTEQLNPLCACVAAIAFGAGRLCSQNYFSSNRLFRILKYDSFNLINETQRVLVQLTVQEMSALYTQLQNCVRELPESHLHFLCFKQHYNI